MPYAYEGFGIAILEAMAFGLPAIGCSNGAAHETISHGTNGFLLDPGDLAGLAPLLLQLHRDREQLQQMALAACATYCQPTKVAGQHSSYRYISVQELKSFRIRCKPGNLRTSGIREYRWNRIIARTAGNSSK